MYPTVEDVSDGGTPTLTVGGWWVLRKERREPHPHVPSLPEDPRGPAPCQSPLVGGRRCAQGVLEGWGRGGVEFQARADRKDLGRSSTPPPRPIS